MPQQYSFLIRENKSNNTNSKTKTPTDNRISDKLYNIISTISFIHDFDKQLSEGLHYIETNTLNFKIIFPSNPIKLILNIDNNATFNIIMRDCTYYWKLTDILKNNTDYCITKLEIKKEILEKYYLNDLSLSPIININTKYGINTPIKICKIPYIEEQFNSNQFIIKVLEILTIDNLTIQLKHTLLRTFSAILSYQNGQLDYKSFTKLRDSFIKYENDKSLYEQFEIESKNFENLKLLQNGLSCLCSYYYQAKYMKDEFKLFFKL